MKHLFSLLAVVCVCLSQSFAQTGAVGIGTSTPNASAMLDVSSTTKGLLVPRMNYGQRNGIASPATGLLVFQTDADSGFYYFDGSGWTALRVSVSNLANKELSNLADITAVNSNLLPDTSGTNDLGSNVLRWKGLYLNGDVYLAGNRFLSDKDNGNNFFGTQAGSANASGLYNTAGGYRSLYSNANGYSNTSLGYQSLYTNTGTYNTSGGYVSLYANTSGYANNGYGAFALYSTTTGSYNVGLGADALIGNTTGNNNTAVGIDALRNLTTTHLNTGIGYYAGDNTYSVTQGTFLGAQSRASTGLSNVTAVGYGAVASASNQVMLGNTSVTSVKAAGSFVVYSDGRFKRDVKQDVPGLAFINKLRPVTYHYNIHDLNKYINPAFSENNDKGVVKGKEMSATESNLDEAAIVSKEKKLYTGFIAQEVESAAKNLNYDFSGVYKPQNDKDAYGLSYSDFVVPLVKAVQELSKANDTKDARITALEKQLNEMNLMLLALRQKLDNTPSVTAGKK